MTENETIKILQRDLQIQLENKALPDGIEAIELAIQALEKQIPKKPYHISSVDDNDNANVECPVCHATADYAVNVIKRGYCWKCGQKLDWSDEE